MNENDIQEIEQEIVEKTSQNSKQNLKHNGINLEKMLKTAAVCVALISWNTTANGLRQYAFPSFWQSYVLSAALQGALYALSIKGIWLILKIQSQQGNHRKIKTIIMRCVFIIIWATLLCASSIFSYVYISKDVYTDQSLREDAQRILSTFCLEEQYKLSETADTLLNGNTSAEQPGDNDSGGIQGLLNGYLTSLVKVDEGVKFTENEKTVLTSMLIDLEKYQDINDDDNELVNTEKLINLINQIMVGKDVDQFIESAKNEADRIRDILNNHINDVQKELDNANNELTNVRVRLASFVSIPAEGTSERVIYNREDDKIVTLEADIKKLNEQQSKLRAEQTIFGSISSGSSEISQKLDSILMGSSNSLYNNIVALNMTMNAEQINIEDIEQKSEEIYSILLQIVSNDNSQAEKLKDYTQFKAELGKYKYAVSAKKDIDVEIERLYHIIDINTLLTETGELAYGYNENSDKKEKDNHEKEADTTMWVSYWEEHLNSLRTNAKQLHTAGMSSEQVAALLEEIDQKERLYLTKLNDVVRAEQLLFHHPYNGLMKFSLIIAFGIDLFSVAMSILLYFFRNKKVNRESKDY